MFRVSRPSQHNTKASGLCLPRASKLASWGIMAKNKSAFAGQTQENQRHSGTMSPGSTDRGSWALNFFYHCLPVQEPMVSRCFKRETCRATVKNWCESYACDPDLRAWCNQIPPGHTAMKRNYHLESRDKQIFHCSLSLLSLHVPARSVAVKQTKLSISEYSGFCCCSSTTQEFQNWFESKGMILVNFHQPSHKWHFNPHFGVVGANLLYIHVDQFPSKFLQIRFFAGEIYFGSKEHQQRRPWRRRRWRPQLQGRPWETMGEQFIRKNGMIQDNSALACAETFAGKGCGYAPTYL